MLDKENGMRKTLAGAVLMMGLACGVHGFGVAQAQQESESQVSPAQALDELLTPLEKECVGVAKAMPADKYNFSPASLKIPGAKFDGVRTFAEEVTHLAQANYYFYGAVSGMKPDVDTRSIGALKTKEEIVSALEASFVFAHKAIATLTGDNVLGTIKPVDDMHSRASLASFGVAHGYDHYGQMVEYLRMNGIVPPGSK